MPSTKQILQESWHRFGEFVPEMRRPWRVGLGVGWLVAVCGLLLVGGCLVARTLPYGAVLAQSVFVLWAAVWVYGGFWRLRAAYRQRYDRWAYRHLFFRLLLPGLVSVVAAGVFPVLVGGQQLLPPALAYSLAAYLLVIAQLLVKRGRELFYNIDLRAFVYSVFPEEGQVLTSGIFVWLRHPIYSAAMRWTFVGGLLRNNAQALLCAGVIAAGLWLWSKVEERDLVERDAGYEDYRRRVPAFFVLHPTRLVQFWRFLVTGKVVNGLR